MPTQEQLPDSTDIVIIGGGIMGTSASFFLTQRTDKDVLLLEKDAIASGATGNSSAILRHHYDDSEVYAESAWWSHEFYREFEQRVAEPLSMASAPLVKFAREDTARAEAVSAGYDVLSNLDIPVTWHDRSSIESRFPMYDTDDVAFGVSDDTAGYSDGTDAASGFARSARRNGATVLTDVGVTDIRVEDGAVVGVETNNGAVACEDVLIVAGGWSPAIASTVGVDVPLTRTRERVFLLDPPEEFKEHHLDDLATGKPPGMDDWYVRQDFGEGVLVATHHSMDHPVDDPDKPLDDPDEEDLLQLIDSLEATIPGLADAGIVGKYSGIYSNTPDHDFIIDQTGPSGCYIACGFSGHGFKHAPSVGRIVTDLITEGSTDFLDIKPFSIDRFEE
ncbi:NAD(P)/FAD-dependent oxidoreductase [Natrarchaeobius chitinivorans]|uniref:FAD-binding oxidoreductase n=1 Tax=Natrarchaeobius chitinivorans TaxID=1679083 RepID=A0A3N6M1F7_NATCH|nr:FAD-binding oxidoreductase [Natrarchaeobius chitinivorans]RQG94184.1 FAD-binding oxidoreductase [Natrarchaeobius chitinivorans]